MKHGMHHGKHLESPPADLPHPKARHVGGHAGKEKHLESPSASPAGLNHHSPTPDIGHKAHRLFSHKPNHRGV